ncbi:MAG: hypothetical protein IPJ77_05325 [Planctomycetes bacterium]|nr:hypothetical protein [Planctomycetota bacterium]
MTILVKSRTRLDAALALPDATLFLVLDDRDETAAEGVHDKAEEIAAPRPWRRVFLVTDDSILTDDERMLWFDEPGHYAVVGGRKKVVAVRGSLDELTLDDGTPIAAMIRTAFNRGDQLK